MGMVNRRRKEEDDRIGGESVYHKKGQGGMSSRYRHGYDQGRDCSA